MKYGLEAPSQLADAGLDDASSPQPLDFDVDVRRRSRPGLPIGP